MTNVLVLHGPNLNLLGLREPDIYGQFTLDDINTKLQSLTSLRLECLQSNAEHVLIDRIQATLHDDTACIIFNPAAYTHTSVALRDALLAVKTPFYEVHLSDIQSREKFRQHSYFSDIAQAVFAGEGINSYIAALKACEDYLTLNKG